MARKQKLERPRKPWEKPPRTYTVDGGYVYPSVTEVLGVMDKSGPLIGWALKEAEKFILEESANLKAAALADTPENGVWQGTLEKTLRLAKAAHREKSQKALDVGTRVHEIVHDLAVGLPVNLESEAPEVKKGVEAYNTWVKNSGYIPIGSELVVFSHKLKTAGTLDSVGLISGTLTLLDWKTSKAIYPEYSIQASVYALCYEEMHGTLVNDIWIIRFDKETGEPEEKRVVDRDASVKCFVGLHECWDWRQRNR